MLAKENLEKDCKVVRTIKQRTYIEKNRSIRYSSTYRVEGQEKTCSKFKQIKQKIKKEERLYAGTYFDQLP